MSVLRPGLGRLRLSSIRSRVLLIALLPALLTEFGMVAYFTRQAFATAENTLQARAANAARQLAGTLPYALASGDTALAHARRLIDEGADLLDIGGESTRPGAADVPAAEERRRVVPLIESLVREGVPLSVDTSKPEVMRAALAAGAAVVNDVCALGAAGAVDAVADADCGVVLMHMQGVPRTMQAAFVLVI